MNDKHPAPDETTRPTTTLRASETGQTTTEYVAIGAVAVALAVGVQWVVLRDGLIGAVSDLTGDLVTAITGMF